MSPAELVGSLRRRGILLVPSSTGDLRYHPRGALSEADREFLAGNRDGILALFESDPIGWRASRSDRTRTGRGCRRGCQPGTRGQPQTMPPVGGSASRQYSTARGGCLGGGAIRPVRPGSCDGPPLAVYGIVRVRQRSGKPVAQIARFVWSFALRRLGLTCGTVRAADGTDPAVPNPTVDRLVGVVVVAADGRGRLVTSRPQWLSPWTILD